MASRRAVEAGKAFVEFFLKDGKLVKGLARSERMVRAWAKRVGNISRRALQVGLSGLAVFSFPLRTFMQFDDQMRELEAKSTGSAEALKKLREQAKELGRTTSATASQVAGLMTELGKAGFDRTQISEMTADIQSLGRATGTELPRAAEIAGNTLNTFKLGVDQAGRVADVLTAATNNSAQGMEDFAEAMKMIAPIAEEGDASVEDVAASLGILANNGIKGSMAGNALARAYKNLASDKTAQTMKQLGIAVEDANGDLRPMAKIIAEIGEATSRMGSREKLAIFETIFGRGQAAALKLAGSTAKFADLLKLIENSQGAAAKAAALMDSGIGGFVRRLISAFEGVNIAIGEALDKVTGRFMDGLTKALGVVVKFIEKNPKLVVGLLTTFAAITALGIAGLALSLLLKGLAVVMGVVRIATIAMSKGVMIAAFSVKLLGGALAFLMSPIGIVIGLIAALAAWFVYTSGAIQAVASFMREEFGETWKMIVALLSSGDLEGAGELAMAMLKTAWAIGIAKLDQQWSEFTGGLASYMLDGLAGVEVLWNDFTTGLVNAFDRAIAAVIGAWQDMTNWLSDKISIVVATVMGQDVDEVRKQLNSDQAATKRDFGGEANSRARDREALRRSREDQIGEKLLEQQKALTAATNAKIAEAEREALRARAAFDQTQARVTRKIEDEKAEDAGDKKKDEDKTEQDRAADEIAAATAAVVRMEAKNNVTLLRSSKGQETLAAAMGFAIDKEPVKTAVESLEETMSEKLDETNELLETGVVLQEANTP